MPDLATSSPTRRSHGALALTTAAVVLAVVVRPGGLVGLALLAALFVPLERLRPAHPVAVRRPGWRADVVHLLVDRLVEGVLLVAGVGAAFVAGRLVVAPAVRDAIGTLPWWVQFAVALVVTDLAFYGAHRLAHTVPWLWRFHAVHHSSERLDWLASARLHPVDQAITRALTVAPLLALGFSRSTFGAYLVFAQLQAIAIHANVRVSLGPLRGIVGTPLYHHWHHASSELPVFAEHPTGVNFAGFPLTDRLFGTLHLPERFPDAYGIAAPMPADWAGQMTAPLRRGG